MFPNPQEALPLPTRPNVEQYKKLAKDLARACKSGDPSAVRRWAVQWMDRLAALQDAPRSLPRNEQEKREAGGGCGLLERLHERPCDAAPARPPVHDQLGDVRAMRLVGGPRRLQLDRPDHPFGVAGDQDDRAFR